MFTKKKKGGINNLSAFTDKPEIGQKAKVKKTLDPKTELARAHSTTSKRKVAQISDAAINLDDIEHNPLLTTSNNVRFFNKMLSMSTDSLKLDKHISDEDRKVVHILSQLHDYLPKGYEKNDENQDYNSLITINNDIRDQNNSTEDYKFNNNNNLDINNQKTFITLTYAQSLDSKIGYRFKKTSISHIETKQMTHFLRYFHDCIVIGFNTFKEDNPNLNFKYYRNTMSYFIKDSTKKLIPLILDPNLRIIDFIEKNGENTINLKKNFETNAGAKPVFISLSSKYNKSQLNKYTWFDILAVPDEIFYKSEMLFQYITKQNPDYKRFMVEGGATIINEMLKQDSRKSFIASKIVTIAPIFLGNGAVNVTPEINEKIELENVQWIKGTSDAVLMSRRDT
ncbi:hypothetical protein QEN19_004091 [Hanseniaspora menglaensis]